MNRRLEMLEKLTSSGRADAFAWYGLAMEYRREDRIDEALATFQHLREEHADYLPTYLMAAQLLSEANRDDEARPWLEQGIALARREGQSQALGELEALLAELD